MKELKLTITIRKPSDTFKNNWSHTYKIIDEQNNSFEMTSHATLGEIISQFKCKQGDF